MMNEKAIQNTQDRTDRKLRYAKIHLEELETSGMGGSDFERAHTESFLFHLLGAKDAFLAELVEYYSLKSVKRISLDSLAKAMKEQSKTSPELDELIRLDRLETSNWLYSARRFRDYSTHLGDLSHHFSLSVGGGGGSVSNVRLEHPVYEHQIERSDFSNWMKNMETLLSRLRQSALEANPPQR